MSTVLRSLLRTGAASFALAAIVAAPACSRDGAPPNDAAGTDGDAAPGAPSRGGRRRGAGADGRPLPPVGPARESTPNRPACPTPSGVFVDPRLGDDAREGTVSRR